MRSSIVCGIDGSADSAAALTVARRLGRRLDLRLVLVHVADVSHGPPAAGPFGGMSTAGPLAAHDEIAAREDAGAALLEQVADAAGIDDAAHCVAIGVPAEELARVAHEEDAELIVVGSRGRGAFKAAFLGSVSTSLVAVARRPVLVVPHGAA